MGLRFPCASVYRSQLESRAIPTPTSTLYKVIVCAYSQDAPQQPLAQRWNGRREGGREGENVDQQQGRRENRTHARRREGMRQHRGGSHCHRQVVSKRGLVTTHITQTRAPARSPDVSGLSITLINTPSSSVPNHRKYSGGGCFARWPRISAVAAVKYTTFRSVLECSPTSRMEATLPHR